MKRTEKIAKGKKRKIADGRRQADCGCNGSLREKGAGNRARVMGMQETKAQEIDM